MKKIGLALGGGAILGAAHIGVLKALEERDIRPSVISGTSIGALVGALYAFGKSWEEIKDLALRLKWMDITQISLSTYGLLSLNKVDNLLLDEIGSLNVEDAKLPLGLVCTNIQSGKKVVKTKGPLSAAVQASMSIPGIFKPVILEDEMLVDGGIVENVPIPTARNLGAEYVIGVDLNGKHEYARPENIIDVMLNSFHLSFQVTAELQTQNADLLIQPDLSAYSRTSTKQVQAIMDRGYEAADRQFQQLGNLFNASE